MSRLQQDICKKQNSSQTHQIDTQTLCAHAPDFCAQLRALLPLVETKPGSRALTRAAAWTSVLPWPAQHHHGHEDPEARAREDFRRGDQDQGSGQGKLRHRHQADPRKRQ